MVRKWCCREQRLHFLTHQPELCPLANFFRGNGLFRGKSLCPPSECASVSGKGLECIIVSNGGGVTGTLLNKNRLVITSLNCGYRYLEDPGFILFLSPSPQGS